MNKNFKTEWEDQNPTNHILIVTAQNKLQKHYCPFLVKAKYDIGIHKKGDVVSVEKILMTQYEDLVFIILNDAYYPKHWNIV